MMLQETKDKPILVIAGPGSGKTRNMVTKIVEAIPKLRPNQVLAAITYTNAATDLIRSKLGEKIEIPPNVFIGTNHSFCYRFIFNPFATLIRDLPQEKTFLETDLEYIIAKSNIKTANNIQKIIYRNGIIKKLLQKGMFGYEQILSVSADIIEKISVRDVVCNRLQYLFIDEFQDANNYQYRIIDAIRKGRKTLIYAVGDPEQYIFGYTSKTKDYANIAINKFRKDSRQSCDNKENLRSCRKIVKFLNNFHTEIQQEAIKEGGKDSGVYFITNSELDSIVAKYRQITRIDGKKTKRYYLSYQNKTFGNHAKRYGLTIVSNDAIRPTGILNESIKLISAIVGLNQKQICKKYGLEDVKYRTLGIKLARAINRNKITDEKELSEFVENDLNLKIENKNPVKIKDQFNKCKNFFRQNEPSSNLHQYSSIHKAKGLEANAVLVVAENRNRLRKWLTTDKKERHKDKIDECRIGFVGFSRAEEFLCIACLEKIDGELKNKLFKLGVEIVSLGE